MNNWTFVSYHNISVELKKISNVLFGYFKDLVNDYCEVLDSINELLNLSFKETEGRLSYWSENIKKLKDIRIMDVFQKNKADDYLVNGFGDLKNVYLKKASAIPGLKFYVERSFYNSKATLSFGFKRSDSADNELETIGIQIEDNQFRLFKWNRNLSADECFDIYSKLGWFDESFDKKTNRCIKNYKTKMSKKYCRYYSSWIYQYFDIWHDNEQNIQQYQTLNNLIVKYLEIALRIVS